MFVGFSSQGGLGGGRGAYGKCLWCSKCGRGESVPGRSLWTGISARRMAHSITGTHGSGLIGYGPRADQSIRKTISGFNLGHMSKACTARLMPVDGFEEWKLGRSRRILMLKSCWQLADGHCA